MSVKIICFRNKVYFNNESEAVKYVEDGYAWGLVKMDHKFTARYRQLYLRSCLSKFLAVQTFYGSCFWRFMQ